MLSCILGTSTDLSDDWPGYKDPSIYRPIQIQLLRLLNLKYLQYENEQSVPLQHEQLSDLIGYHIK